MEMFPLRPVASWHYCHCTGPATKWQKQTSWSSLVGLKKLYQSCRGYIINRNWSRTWCHIEIPWNPSKYSMTLEFLLFQILRSNFTLKIIYGILKALLFRNPNKSWFSGIWMVVVVFLQSHKIKLLHFHFFHLFLTHWFKN